jgi:DNA adenine methylase
MAGAPLPRPFLKWAGGKTQLIGPLIRHAPPAFSQYFEPFAGSGALFFRLFREGRLRGVRLSDSNAELMDTYTAVRDQAEEVISLLANYPHSQEFYYTLRAVGPRALDLPARAARMIYLNKTGYNGLYRVNRSGQFNVPFGRYKAPRTCDPDNLRAVSAALRGVDIRCAPFEAMLEWARPGDLVYFDPPYAPLSATAYFTAYQAHGFSSADQARLRDVCAELARRGVSVMLSNSDTELIHSLYGAAPFVLSRVQAGRAINSNASRRGKITELIITSYQTDDPSQ